MKKAMILLLSVSLALSLATVRAETMLPTFQSFAEGRATLLVQAENSSTATAQYQTTPADAAAFLETLSENGFLRNGIWNLDVGGDAPLTVLAYTDLGQDAPALFAMDIGEDTIFCRLLLQVLPYPDGELVLSVTWAQGVKTYEITNPMPAPKTHVEYDNITTQIPCDHCNGTGKCPHCNGTGHYTSHYTGETLTCSVIDCPMCDGNKYLPEVKLVTRQIRDKGYWELQAISTQRTCPMVPYHDTFFHGGSVCPFCRGQDTYDHVTNQWVWMQED